MTAETLRRAAALMRERAGKASAGPWGTAGHDVLQIKSALQVADAFGYDATELANAEHIASWHPAVALAVADLLDRLADESWCCEECQFGGDVPHPVAALDLARLYLGEGS